MSRRLGIIIGSAALAVMVIVALVIVLSGHKSSNDGTSKTPSASGSPTTGVPTTASGRGTALAPKSGVLFGSSAGSDDQTQTGRVAAVNALQSSLGVSLSIVHVYRRLDEPINSSSNVQFVAEHKTLLISWAGGDTIKMRDRQLDATIAKRAQEVVALKVRVFFEYRWEMERSNLAGTVHSATDYIAAWDRVRSIFAAQHVTNAEFVWCPLAKGFATGAAQPYYPGDAEVDWICADLYSPSNQSPKSFAALAQPFLMWASTHPSKPIMFGEFGADEAWGSSERVAWLSGIHGVLADHPQIKALVYYNSNAGQARYSLNSDPKALAALAALAKAAPPKYR